MAIEIIDKTHKNKIVICICQRPNLSVAVFNEDYLKHPSRQTLLWKKKSNKSQPKCIKINETYITDQDEIAKNFKEYFETIAGKIDNKTPQSKQKITVYLKHRNLNFFFFEPISGKEIQNIISNAANNEVVGPNSVPIVLLKQFKKELSIPLPLITNLSFKTNIFPQACKIANVIPIYKKAD